MTNNERMSLGNRFARPLQGIVLLKTPLNAYYMGNDSSKDQSFYAWDGSSNAWTILYGTGDRGPKPPSNLPPSRAPYYMGPGQELPYWPVKLLRLAISTRDPKTASLLSNSIFSLDPNSRENREFRQIRGVVYRESHTSIFVGLDRDEKNELLKGEAASGPRQRSLRNNHGGLYGSFCSCPM